MIKRAPEGTQCECGSHRMGTVNVARIVLQGLFGRPNIGRSCDNKVTHGWLLTTPHGLCEVRDYWSNQAGEYSIASAHADAAAYVIRALRDTALLNAREGM